MEKVQAELQNLLSFIKAGNFSKLVSEAIVDAEGRSDKLQTKMKAMEFQTRNAFKAPPKEWIEHRLDKFKETLGMNTKASALALKDLLGTIEMEAVAGECVVENGNLIQNKPYLFSSFEHRYPCALRRAQGYELVPTSEEEKSAPYFLW